MLCFLSPNQLRQKQIGINCSCLQHGWTEKFVFMLMHQSIGNAIMSKCAELAWYFWWLWDTLLSHCFAVLFWWTWKGFRTSLEGKSEETSENQGLSSPAVFWAKLVNERESALFSYFLWQKVSCSIQPDTHQQAALHQGRDNAFRREAGCCSVQQCGTIVSNSWGWGKGCGCIALLLKLNWHERCALHKCAERPWVKSLAATIHSIATPLWEMGSVLCYFGAGCVPPLVPEHSCCAGQQCSNDAVVCTDAVSY